MLYVILISFFAGWLFGRNYKIKKVEKVGKHMTGFDIVKRK